MCWRLAATRDPDPRAGVQGTWFVTTQPREMPDHLALSQAPWGWGTAWLLPLLPADPCWSLSAPLKLWDQLCPPEVRASLLQPGRPDTHAANGELVLSLTSPRLPGGLGQGTQHTATCGSGCGSRGSPSSGGTGGVLSPSKAALSGGG